MAKHLLLALGSAPIAIARRAHQSSSCIAWQRTSLCRFCKVLRRWGLIRRLLKFNSVGAIGILVQLSALALLVRGLRLPITVATGLAVEAATIHNFIWHHGWTWCDRKRSGPGGGVVQPLRALLRFNFTTGLISLLGNVVFMHLLASTAGIGLLRANLMTIAICSLANFIVSDRFVFRTRK